MGLWRRIIGKEKSKRVSKIGESISNHGLQDQKTPMEKDLKRNLEMIKGSLKDCDDVIYREIKIGYGAQWDAALICIDGMVDKDLLNEFVLNNLMLTVRMVPPQGEEMKVSLPEQLKAQCLAVAEMKEVETLEEGLLALLSGETLLLLDRYDQIMIIASKGWQSRGVAEPVSEGVIRGPRDGFTENLRTNTALVRRRIRDPRLKVKSYQVGTRSKTDVVVFYIEDLVDHLVLQEVDRRLKDISIDAVLDSGYIEQFLEDSWISPFSQVKNTERPDKVAANLYEGKVAIVSDNSPFALVIPATINGMLQSPEDYYERWNIGTAVRTLRIFASIISLVMPAVYVSITAFHPEMIPTQLALSIAANRKSVPFPAIVEALIMETTIELLREAGVRLPGPIGATIGIVGGLVIGQAAVEAGIVSPLMVIVVSVTAIASFSVPSYNLAIGFRLVRFGFILVAGCLGLYGLILALLVLIIHLCGLKSFGVPILYPYVTYVDHFGDLKDTAIRFPWPGMKTRSSQVNPHQRHRIKENDSETGKKEK